MTDTRDRWPALPLAGWRDTCQTLHMYTQVVGKVRLAVTPRVNQWWNVPLYLTARGLTTGPMPQPGGVFELTFDLVAHRLIVSTSAGETRTVPLGIPVHAFYRGVLDALQGLGLHVTIWPHPVEVAHPVPFDQDRRHAYDPAAVTRFHQVLARVAPVFETFRSRFRGKCSPVHFFWGSFDLAVSRYPGLPAPPRPGADRITAVAYDEAVSSLGFWPGGEWPGAGEFDACFYAYTSPKPDGLEAFTDLPPGAFWEPRLGEFMLPYAEVIASQHPATTLLTFAEKTYQAGARLSGWDVSALVYPPPSGPSITFMPQAGAPTEPIPSQPTG
jgi:hypothetical protein